MHPRRRFTARELDEQVRTLRILAVLAVGVAIMIVALWLAGIDVRDADPPARSAPERVSDPLQAELLRCNGLGQSALDDAACRAAWAETRRRFFGSRKQHGEARP